MNALAKAKIDAINSRGDVLKAALYHFGNKKEDEAVAMIAAAVDFAHSDDLLFEEFQIWMDEQSDEALLFQVDHFLKNVGRKSLPPAERDLTGKLDKIEAIKQSVNEEAGQSFSRRLRELALKRGLDTNAKLGGFLEVTAERARVMLKGRHKPQTKTLVDVAKRFRVPLEFLLES